jgi:hypothetical protein
MQKKIEVLQGEKDDALFALEEAQRASALQLQIAEERAESLRRQMDAAVARCNAINEEELHEQTRQLESQLRDAKAAHACALTAAQESYTEQARCMQSKAEQELAAAKASHDKVSSHECFAPLPACALHDACRA